MDKAQLKRHNLIFISQQEKQRIWQSLAAKYTGRKQELVRDILLGNADVPGILRRSDEPYVGIPIGFVHTERIDGNRIRVAAYADEKEIKAIVTPYEVLEKAGSERTMCLQAATQLFKTAQSFGLEVGVLGSVGLELATGLPYTDDKSDLDFLLKPASYDKLEAFYKKCQADFQNINMDFELDLPNGFGVKLAEIFMTTRTVLGKSIDKVDLLYKKDIMQFLN